MARSTPTFLSGLRDRLAALTGSARAETRHPEVIVHDPAAAGPQDLDDVFRDAKTQERVAAAIARAAQAKPKD